MFQCVRERGSVVCILARSETLVRSTKFLKQSQGQFLCFYALISHGLCYTLATLDATDGV